jgi:hypothetical protein
LNEGGSDVVVPVRPGPSAVSEAAVAIFIGASRRLAHAIEDA